jgi:hypothetical protein
MLTGYKTIFVSFATMLLGILQSTAVTNIVTQYPGAITTALGGIMLLLRLVTNTPPAINVAMTPKASLQTPVVTMAAKANAAPTGAPSAINA